jgi:hypothetical protein
MEGLLQPDMIDAIYEGKCPGEIGILMHMMHAIGRLCCLSINRPIFERLTSIFYLFMMPFHRGDSGSCFAPGRPDPDQDHPRPVLGGMCWRDES